MKYNLLNTRGPAALASVPYGHVLVRVRVRVKLAVEMGLGFWHCEVVAPPPASGVALFLVPGSLATGRAFGDLLLGLEEAAAAEGGGAEQAAVGAAAADAADCPAV